MKHLLTLIFMLFSVIAFSQTVANTTILDGSGSGDPDGTISSYEWTKIAGPSGGDVITNANAVKATVVYTLPGTYSYQLKVTDNQGGYSFDTTQRFVLPANVRPHANAGGDQTIQMPAGTTSYQENKLFKLLDRSVADVKEMNKMYTFQLKNPKQQFRKMKRHNRQLVAYANSIGIQIAMK